jgi:hypothetical protein
MMMRLASIRLAVRVRPYFHKFIGFWEAEAYIQRLGYTVSHEESFVVSIGGSNATRTALVMHVLFPSQSAQAIDCGDPYIDPTLKSVISMIFRDRTICSPRTIGMGRTNNMISVMMLITAVAM